MEIRDSVLMITGGAIRLGRSHALHLARKGAHVAFTYLSGEPWEQTKADIEALGVRCAATELDVRDLAGIKQWTAKTLELFGQIDILINNASPWLGRPFLELTDAEWELSVGVNAKAAFFQTSLIAYCEHQDCLARRWSSSRATAKPQPNG